MGNSPLSRGVAIPSLSYQSGYNLRHRAAGSVLWIVLLEISIVTAVCLSMGQQSWLLAKTYQQAEQQLQWQSVIAARYRGCVTEVTRGNTQRIWSCEAYQGVACECEQYPLAAREVYVMLRFGDSEVRAGRWSVRY